MRSAPVRPNAATHRRLRGCPACTGHSPEDVQRACGIVVHPVGACRWVKPRSTPLRQMRSKRLILSSMQQRWRFCRLSTAAPRPRRLIPVRRRPTGRMPTNTHCHAHVGTPVCVAGARHPRSELLTDHALAGLEKVLWCSKMSSESVLPVCLVTQLRCDLGGLYER